MISKLRELDEATFTAVGPKYDLEKVLEAGRSVLLPIIGRSAMRFPDAPAAAFEIGPGESAPADPEAFATFIETFREINREAFDATDLSLSLAFGPYLATWSPLGVAALYGRINNCVTTFEQPWEDLDVTPTLLLQSRDAPYRRMGRPATRFLVETLGPGPYGTEVLFDPDEDDAHLTAVRFPHDAFGAGSGRIRIHRYLKEPG